MHELLRQEYTIIASEINNVIWELDEDLHGLNVDGKISLLYHNISKK